MPLGKWKIKKEVAELEAMISQTKDAKMREILALLPPGIPIKMLKFAFVDKVVNAHGGNLSAASRELGVPYRTLTNWIHETDHTTAQARGRRAAGMAKAHFRRKKDLDVEKRS